MTIRDVGLIGAEKLTGTPLDVGSGAEPDAASRSAIWRHGARSKGEVSRVQWERPTVKPGQPEDSGDTSPGMSPLPA